MKQVRKRQEDAKQAVKAEGLAALEKLRQIQMVSKHSPMIVDCLCAIAVSRSVLINSYGCRRKRKSTVI